MLNKLISLIINGNGTVWNGLPQFVYSKWLSKINLVSLFVFIIVIVNSFLLNGQVTENAIARLSDRIQSVEKVDQLYSIRFAVAKYAAREDLTLKQQAELDKAMISLSQAFKDFNHYRNAADVYKERLDYNNKYLTRYNTFAKDSLVALHKGIVAQENEKIASLDSEIKNLNSTRAAVSGLKQKYYTFGGIGAIAAVIIFFMIAIAKNRAIKQAELQIASNRERLLHGVKKVTETGMVTGSIGFCRETAVLHVEAINKILESQDQQEEKKLFQNELAALQKAVAKFRQLVP